MSAVAGFAASPLVVDNPPSHAAAQWRSEDIPGPPTLSVSAPLNTVDSYAVLPSGCNQAVCATTITLTSVASNSSETASDVGAIETPGSSGAALASAIRAGRQHHPTGHGYPASLAPRTAGPGDCHFGQGDDAARHPHHQDGPRAQLSSLRQ